MRLAAAVASAGASKSATTPGPLLVDSGLHYRRLIPGLRDRYTTLCRLSSPPQLNLRYGNWSRTPSMGSLRQKHLRGGPAFALRLKLDEKIPGYSGDTKRVKNPHKAAADADRLYRRDIFFQPAGRFCLD